MNKCIKRLVESLFDDDFDDIVNHNDEVTTIGRMIEIKLPYCESYLSKQCGGEHVYLETDLNTDTILKVTEIKKIIQLMLIFCQQMLFRNSLMNFIDGILKMYY